MFRKTKKEEKAENKDEGSMPTSPVSGDRDGDGDGDGAVGASGASGEGASGAVSEGQSEQRGDQCDHGADVERKLPNNLPVKQDKPESMCVQFYTQH